MATLVAWKPVRNKYTLVKGTTTMTNWYSENATNCYATSNNWTATVATVASTATRLLEARWATCNGETGYAAYGWATDDEPTCYGTSTANLWDDCEATTAGVTWHTAADNFRKAFKHVQEEIKVDPNKRLQEIIASRTAPAIIIPGYRKVPEMPRDVREERARATLRRVVGDDKFRAFQCRGFISVKGKDGYNYQLFPGHGITHVFDQGKLIEKLCVVFPGNFTPTDSLIMRYLMILNDPKGFWDKAIKHGAHDSRGKFKIKPVDNRNLSDIFRELKANPTRLVNRYQEVSDGNGLQVA